MNNLKVNKYVTLEDTLSPALMCDFYKISHKNMYPKGTEIIYSTWTPRTSRIKGIDKIVVFGIQLFLTKLQVFFQNNFFSKPFVKIEMEYKAMLDSCLGIENADATHLKKLHDLGFLPLEIRAIPEAFVVPVGTPIMTIMNTRKEFFWLTNYIETFASCELWQAATSATIAHEYKKILTKHALETVGNDDFVVFQGHDFSMRGMSSLSSAISSGMGHLLSFLGTDTIPAIQAVKYFYDVRSNDGLLGTSVPATEHSIQCAYGNDEEYIEEIITKLHPNGIVSIVSDGYDFWNVIENILPKLKDKILSRAGGKIADKVVIRPDSGDPFFIICGNPDAETEIERKGAVEALWDLFGGTLTEKGYKVLDNHIGLIYGDAMTLDLIDRICERLKEKGFASINCVFGIGSYSYQYNTRDTFGFAMKSTYCEINGNPKNIFKDPKTDSGIKKSRRGLVKVDLGIGGFRTTDECSFEDMQCLSNALKVVYRDGELTEGIKSFRSLRYLLSTEHT
jgi:nicotinamide phosphoribosyltransferase